MIVEENLIWKSTVGGNAVYISISQKTFSSGDTWRFRLDDQVVDNVYVRARSLVLTIVGGYSSIIVTMNGQSREYVAQATINLNVHGKTIVDVVPTLYGTNTLDIKATFFASAYDYPSNPQDVFYFDSISGEPLTITYNVNIRSVPSQNIWVWDASGDLPFNNGQDITLPIMLRGVNSGRFTDVNGNYNGSVGVNAGALYDPGGATGSILGRLGFGAGTSMIGCGVGLVIGAGAPTRSMCSGRNALNGLTSQKYYQEFLSGPDVITLIGPRGSIWIAGDDGYIRKTLGGVPSANTALVNGKIQVAIF